MRTFNTAGPVEPTWHYCIPPLERLDLEDVLALIHERTYFVMHAPRQSGKTSTLLALRDLLNGTGAFRCVYATFEYGRTARNDVDRAIRPILSELASQASSTLGDDFLAKHWQDIVARDGSERALRAALQGWAESDPRPLVLLIDEIDSLSGDSLLAVLQQVRAGYYSRPQHFPQSIVLCGLRDVRDYRIGAGGSPFNIKAESLRLGDFSRDEVGTLFAQHTAETGQEFAPEALDAVWSRTQGQPWLVNALGRGACFRSRSGRDRSRRILADDFADVQERLILRRETHLDQLAEKLNEDRVRRVIEPLLSGGDEFEFSQRDIEYVRDLGLIAVDDPLRIANPIYAEVVPRELTAAAQSRITHEQTWYVDPNGRLELGKLLAAFQEFFRKHSESWVERMEYKEAGPQLLLHAFLQRIINGGGVVVREYGLGRGRTDILVVWPQGGTNRHHVIECKIRYGSLQAVIDEGAEQTSWYMARCAAEDGHLVIFDRSTSRGWDEKVFHRRHQSQAGHWIDIWGM